MHAIVQHAFGSPEKLRYEEVQDPVPGDGQVRIAVEAAGVHFIDTRIREGFSSGPLGAPELPMTPGREVAGVVDGRRVVAHLGTANESACARSAPTWPSTTRSRAGRSACAPGSAGAR